MQDNEIIALYWARDQRAILETSERYGGYCAAIARNILYDAGDTEECVNDTWLSAWNAMPPHRPSILSTFLGRLTRNLAINRWQKRAAEKRGGGEMALILDELANCVSGAEDTEDAVIRQELLAAVNEFLRHLPERKRQIFLCRYWYSDSVADIAARFGMKENAVSKTLSRVRKDLRSDLTKRGVFSVTALTFYELLGDVDEQLVRTARPERTRRRPVRPLLLAAVLALLLAGFSEATRGSVSNLFVPLYGSSRTEIIDGVGRPVNASATAGGYTITAEAVIGDRYNLAIVYTLTRDDGEPIPDNIAFDDWTNSLTVGSGSGFYGVEDVDGLPANQKRLMEQRDRELPLILRRHAHVRFSGLRELVEDGTPGEGPLLAEGPWVLDFSLRYADTTQQVSIPKDFVVTDENGREYAISKVQLSPFSVHVDLTTANPSAGYTWEEYTAAGRPDSELEYLPDFTVELKLKDGIEPPWIGKNVSGHGTIGESTQKNSVNAHFGVPVLPEDVESIVLCGTEIPVK